jgi:hypothetical protein
VRVYEDPHSSWFQVDYDDFVEALPRSSDTKYTDKVGRLFETGHTEMRIGEERALDLKGGSISEGYYGGYHCYTGVFEALTEYFLEDDWPDSYEGLKESDVQADPGDIIYYESVVGPNVDVIKESSRSPDPRIEVIGADELAEFCEAKHDLVEDHPMNVEYGELFFDGDDLCLAYFGNTCLVLTGPDAGAQVELDDRFTVMRVDGIQI